MKWKPHARSAAYAILAMYFILAAAFYLLTTLCAIGNFGWHQLMFDQWRTYETFLTLPFPQNVLQLENGHRPILPNLIRIAEIHWFAANQLLQASVGTCCAILTSAIVAYVVWRERQLSLATRCAGAMVGVLGIFWLANARMLLHGYEMLHVYPITLMLTLACCWIWRAREQNSIPWLAASCAACVVATFCFGPGIATFPAIIVVGALARLSWRRLLLPIGIMAICLVLYLYVLPGERAVRHILGFQPLESARFAAQWLSSPWVNGWLGLANPPAPWLFSDRSQWYGEAIAASAEAMVTLSTLQWRSLGLIIGIAGVGAFLARVWWIYTSRHLTRLQAVAIGMAAFALASAVEISIGRLDFFRVHPDQVYADRYLVWPCLFWSSLVLLFMSESIRGGTRWLKFPGIAFLVALPLMMFPTHRNILGWGSDVYRNGQRTAASLRSGVFDKDHFTGNMAAGRTIAEERAVIGPLRAHHLVMFADPQWQAVGKPWTGALAQTPDFAVIILSIDAFNDDIDQVQVAHFSGWVKTGIAAIQNGGQLAVLSPENLVVGLAQYSFIAPGAQVLRLGIPRKRGFDGYIRNYDPHESYRLAVIDFANNRGTLLAALPPSAGAKSSAAIRTESDVIP